MGAYFEQVFIDVSLDIGRQMDEFFVGGGPEFNMVFGHDSNPVSFRIFS